MKKIKTPNPLVEKFGDSQVLYQNFCGRILSGRS